MTPSITCDSSENKEQRKAPSKMKPVEIREIEMTRKDTLEYVVNFSNASLQILSADELVKLWP